MINNQELLDELVSLLDKKIIYLNELYNIMKNQKYITVDKNLTNYIKRKKMITEEIDKLDIKFCEKFAKIKLKNGVKELNDITDLDKASCKELKDLVMKVNSILSKINHIESSNNIKLNKSVSSLKGYTELIRDVKKTNISYSTGYNELPSYFIDKKK